MKRINCLLAGGDENSKQFAAFHFVSKFRFSEVEIERRTDNQTNNDTQAMSFFFWSLPTMQEKDKTDIEGVLIYLLLKL